MSLYPIPSSSCHPRPFLGTNGFIVLCLTCLHTHPSTRTQARTRSHCSSTHVSRRQSQHRHLLPFKPRVPVYLMVRAQTQVLSLELWLWFWYDGACLISHGWLLSRPLTRASFASSISTNSSAVDDRLAVGIHWHCRMGSTGVSSFYNTFPNPTTISVWPLCRCVLTLPAQAISRVGIQVPRISSSFSPAQDSSIAVTLTSTAVRARFITTLPFATARLLIIHSWAFLDLFTLSSALTNRPPTCQSCQTATGPSAICLGRPRSTQILAFETTTHLGNSRIDIPPINKGTNIRRAPCSTSHQFHGTSSPDRIPCELLWFLAFRSRHHVRSHLDVAHVTDRQSPATVIMFITSELLRDSRPQVDSIASPFYGRSRQDLSLRKCLLSDLVDDGAWAIGSGLTWWRRQWQNSKLGQIDPAKNLDA